MSDKSLPRGAAGCLVEWLKTKFLHRLASLTSIPKRSSTWDEGVPTRDWNRHTHIKGLTGVFRWGPKTLTKVPNPATPLYQAPSYTICLQSDSRSAKCLTTRKVQEVIPRQVQSQQLQSHQLGASRWCRGVPVSKNGAKGLKEFDLDAVQEEKKINQSRGKQKGKITWNPWVGLHWVFIWTDGARLSEVAFKSHILCVCTLSTNMGS